MALERNDPALQFDPGFDLEFEQMLQHHLKRGGASVVACIGFDAETASAFLENALRQPARLRYESHLAACPACRRHVIELSRLARLVPRPEAVSVPAGDRLTVWAKWKAAVSEWQWKWQTAGLTTAAMAMLVAALTYLPSRQSDQMGYTAQRSVGTVSAPASKAPTEIGGTPQPASEPLRTSVVNEVKEERFSPTRTLAGQALDAAVPRPSVSPKPGEQFVAIAASPAPAEVRKRGERIVNLPSASTSFPAGAVVPLSQPAGRMVLNEKEEEVAFGDAAPPASGNIVEPQVGPLPEDNPMRAVSTGEADNTRKPQLEKNPSKPGWFERARAFVPRRKAESDNNASSAIRDEEAVTPLTVRIHNRVFYYQNGTWIDKEYKTEMAWRVTKLVKGSAEFERVVAEEPQLKPYFEKASIIVVWRDKIYKVVTK